MARVAIVTGGTERMRVSNSGVTIGGASVEAPSYATSAYFAPTGAF